MSSLSLRSPLTVVRAGALAGLSFVVCLLLFGLPHLGIQTSDDAATLAAAVAWWERGSPAISHMRWLNERVEIGREGRDGELYTKYGIGQIGLGAALYGLGRTSLPRGAAFDWAGFRLARSLPAAQLAQWLNVLLGGLAVALVVYAVGRRAGLAAAALGGALLATASPFWLASRGFGSEVGASLGLLVAVLLADAGLRSSRRGLLALSALAVVAAALFRPSALVFAVAYLAWLWGRPRRDWLGVGLALSVSVAMLVGYNFYRYGTLWDGGYSGGFQLQWIGVVGNLVSPGRGLLFFAPWTLAFIPAARHGLARRRAFWLGLSLGVAAFFLFHAMWREWEGGWAYGPRLLIPLLPVLAAATAAYLVRRPLLAAVMWAFGFLAQVATLRLDPIVTHDQVIREGGIAFDQTVWSLGDSILAHQLRVGLGALVVAWLLILALAAAVAVVAWQVHTTRGLAVGEGKMGDPDAFT